jgi:creatinine amidohydrolase
MYSFFDTSPELAQSGCDTAVLPLASLEPKGPHLPVGLDLILAYRFARDFCRGKAVYLLPAFPFSSAPEAVGFPGFVSLRQQTLFDVLFDVSDVLRRQDFRRLVVLDFSLYNWIVKQAVRELNLDRGSLQVVWVRPKEFGRESAEEELLPDHGGGAVETALALHLVPGLVGEPPADHCPPVPRETIDYHGLGAAAPDGYWGKPARATAELGRRLYRAMLDGSRDFVDRALQLFPGGKRTASGRGSELWWPAGDLPGADRPEPGRGASRPSASDWRCSTGELTGGRTELAVLPTGALEQHSGALPLATDFLQALEIGRRIAEEVGGYLLPALPIVTSWGHIHFRGTVTLRAMTARRVLEDVAESLAAGGTRCLVIFNTHGGNWVLKPTLVELNRRHGNALRVIATGDLLVYRGQRPVESLHADAMEASFIKACYPDTLREAEIEDHSPRCAASAFDLVGIRGVSPRGVWGFPSKATAARGKAETEERVRKAVEYVRRHSERGGGARVSEGPDQEGADEK